MLSKLARELRLGTGRLGIVWLAAVDQRHSRTRPALNCTRRSTFAQVGAACTMALPTKDDMINPDVPIRYDAPSALRKWPSMMGERIRPADGAAHEIFSGTLYECIREFSAKPISQHHLYDVATGDQPAFEQNILSAPDVTKIIARADFPKLLRRIGDAAVK
jgi:hypothetical protein